MFLLDKTSTFIVVYFIAFAIIDFIIYAKLSKYLYMSGGATKEEVKFFLDKQVMHGQRRLVDWLYSRTPCPDMFHTMLTVCNVLTGVTALTPVFIFFLVMNKNTVLIIVCSVVVALISVVTALYGFIFSKKILIYFDNLNCNGYEFNKNQVKRRTLSFTQKEKEKVDKQVKVGQRTAITIIFLLILSIPLIALFQNWKNNNINNDTTTEQTQQKQILQPITGFKNVKSVLGISEEVRLDESDEIKTLFPEFNFSEECIVITDRGLYFGYYELNDPKQAIELQKEIKSKIINDYIYYSQNFNEKDESKEDFTLYTFETEDIYAVSICCEKSVIYAYSNLNNEVWLKSLLNNLGYLEDF